MADTATTEKPQKSADEKIAEALAQLNAPKAVEKSLADTQREEASDFVQSVLADAIVKLDVKSFKGEAKEEIARAASSLTRALSASKQAVKKTAEADLNALPGVKTFEAETPEA